jgi:hypothetical protein
MVFRNVLLVGFVCGMLTGVLLAESAIFVNNKPFQGSVSGESADLMLEAKTLAEMTTIGLEVTDDKVLLEGEELSVSVEDGRLMVSAKDLVEKAGGRYLVNKDLQSIDIYLIDSSKSSQGSGYSSTSVEHLIEHSTKKGKRYRPVSQGDVPAGKLRAMDATLSRLAAAVAGNDPSKAGASLGPAVKLEDSSVQNLFKNYGGKQPSKVDCLWGPKGPLLAHLYYGRAKITLLVSETTGYTIYAIQ